MIETCALIPAAGHGKRFSGVQSKLFVEIAGIPVLGHSLLAMERSDVIQSIVLVISRENQEKALQLAKDLGISKLYRVLEGGSERQDSVENGLQAVPERTEIVAVHDGARPLVSSALIERCVEGACQWGAVAPALPVVDTIKRVSQDFVKETLLRKELCRVQTPQTFRLDLLKKAYQNAREKGVTGTDDASLVEILGEKVHLVPGEERNLKITTQQDIGKAEQLLGVGPRVGFGYDVHRLVEGRKLFLGGVEIPHEKGLLGHSDADALLHALCDALLGAAGLSDIGVYFPDNDPRFEGIESIKLLRNVADLIREKGFGISNVDATVIAQRPKISSVIPRMKSMIADALQIPVGRIGIKATTNERLDSIGNEEGIAAYAVASLYPHPFDSID